MNILFLAALGLIPIFFGALPVSAGERQTSLPQKTERASPFRCNALALSPSAHNYAETAMLRQTRPAPLPAVSVSNE